MSVPVSNGNGRPSQERSLLTRSFTAAGDGCVRCKHCSKVIALDGVEEHEAFFCPLKPIRCQHFKSNGEVCGFVCSGTDALRDHYKSCKDHPRKRRSVSMREGGSPRNASDRGLELCDDCQETFPDRGSLTEHQQVCSLKSVPCPLRCGLWMPRGRVPEHILSTAGRHKPLRRPSVADYGGDNMHMVVAVLMEALHIATKTMQKSAVYEETVSNIEPSMAFTHPSPRRSMAFAEAVAVAPQSPKSTSLRAAGSLGSSGLRADAALSHTFSAAASSESQEEGKAEGAEVMGSVRIVEPEQDVAPPLNSSRNGKGAEQSPARAPPTAPASAPRQRKHKAAPLLGKGRRSSIAGNNNAAASALPLSPAKASFRASPSTAAAEPSKVRYEDFVLKPAVATVRAKSPPSSVRLRPTYSRPAVSPREQPRRARLC